MRVHKDKNQTQVAISGKWMTVGKNNRVAASISMESIDRVGLALDVLGGVQSDGEYAKRRAERMTEEDAKFFMDQVLWRLGALDLFNKAKEREKESRCPSLRTSPLALEALKIYSRHATVGKDESRYATWDEVNQGAGCTDDVVRQYITKAEEQAKARKLAKEREEAEQARKLRTSEIALKALVIYNGTDFEYKTWDETNKGTGCSDTVVKYWIEKAEVQQEAEKSAAAYKLRTSEDALKGLKIYNTAVSWVPDYPDWFSVAKGVGVSDNTVELYIRKALRKEEEAKKEHNALRTSAIALKALVLYNVAGEHSFTSWDATYLNDDQVKYWIERTEQKQQAHDDLRTSPVALRALALYNSSYNHTKKEPYATWDATNHGSGSTDDDVQYWIRKAKASKSEHKTKRRIERDAIVLRLVSKTDRVAYTSLEGIKLDKEALKYWRRIAKADMKLVGRW